MKNRDKNRHGFDFMPVFLLNLKNRGFRFSERFMLNPQYVLENAVFTNPATRDPQYSHDYRDSAGHRFSEILESVKRC